jgi:hypothetical protein
LLPLQLLLLHLFLRGVMADSATGYRTQHGMMAGHVPRHRTHRRTFDAAFCYGRLRANRESQDADQR